MSRRKPSKLSARGVVEMLEPRLLLSSAEIQGTVWNDLDGNGTRDAGEPALPGWTVFLDADGNGQQGATEVSTTTDGNGQYAFESLAAGQYQVVAVEPAGWECTSPAAGWGVNQQVSVAGDGIEGNGYSYSPSISGDGRYVAFMSPASNLVAGDANNIEDIFVYDRQTGSIERVSVAGNGAESNDYSSGPSISGDGRFVAFQSFASNLVADDTNNVGDIFVYDRQTGVVQRVSMADDGAEGDSDSYEPSISGDGRFVAFHSNASNLVTEDNNGTWDVFVYDRQAGSIQRVSVADDGTEGNAGGYAPSISGDGRFVAFYSDSSNLVAGDTNDAWDVFVYDRQTESIQRVSVAGDGTQGNADSYDVGISGDGRLVAFMSLASNLIADDTNDTSDIFVYNRQTGAVERVSVADDGTEGDGESWRPSVSGDGRFVSFHSLASNLAAGDTNGTWDVFVYDRQVRSIRRGSVSAAGAEGNGDSYDSAISGDGRVVAFTSSASDLVEGDTNACEDTFTSTLLRGQEVSLTPGQVVTGADLGLHTIVIGWTGDQDCLWHNADNWVSGTVPDAATPIQFDGTPPANQPVLYQDQAISGLNILENGWTLDLNGHTLSVGTGGLSLPGGATPTSTINLGSGNLVVEYSGASPLKTIEGWIKAGGGTKTNALNYDWNGTGGITSSAAAGNKQYTSLGLRDNGFDLFARPGMVSVDGVPVAADAIVVKYTWIGDMDLDGKVTVNDYLEFLYYYSNKPAAENITWMTGDFNYDGRINVNDYLMLLAGYGNQSGALAAQVETTQPAAHAAVAPVEPADTLVDLLRQSGGNQAVADNDDSVAGTQASAASADLTVRPADDGAANAAAVLAIR